MIYALAHVTFSFSILSFSVCFFLLLCGLLQIDGHDSGTESDGDLNAHLNNRDELRDHDMESSEYTTTPALVCLSSGHDWWFGSSARGTE